MCARSFLSHRRSHRSLRPTAKTATETKWMVLKVLVQQTAARVESQHDSHVTKCFAKKKLDLNEVELLLRSIKINVTSTYEYNLTIGLSWLDA